MEKIKINYILLLIVVSIFSFISLYILESNITKGIWIGSMTALPVIYLFISEKFTKSGYYFSNDGILIFENGNLKCTTWDKVDAKRTFYCITVELDNKKFNIDLSRIQSAKLLVEKYCPKEHELYKLVEEYAKEKRLSF